MLQLPTHYHIPEPGLSAPHTKCHLLSPHQTPTTHSRAMGPARIWVPGCKTLRVGGFLEMFKELTPHLSFKNIKKTKGVMNGG